MYLELKGKILRQNWSEISEKIKKNASFFAFVTSANSKLLLKSWSWNQQTKNFFKHSYFIWFIRKAFLTAKTWRHETQTFVLIRAARVFEKKIIHFQANKTIFTE